MVLPDTLTTFQIYNSTSIRSLTIPSIIIKEQWGGATHYSTISDLLGEPYPLIKTLTISGCFSDSYYGTDVSPLQNLPNLEQVNILQPMPICKNMFSGLSNLKEINLNEDISYIGINAFAGCTALESITLPKGITTLNAGMFMGCTSLQQINYTQNFTLIPKDFAKNCPSLTSFTFNCDVEIEESAFEGCTSLSTITNQNYVTKLLGPNAFAYTTISTFDLSRLEDTALMVGTFKNCANLTTVN